VNTLTLPDPRLIPDIADWCHAVARDWDTDPTGHRYAFISRDEFYERFGYYAASPPGYTFWQPMGIPVPLAEAVAELLDREAERAGRQAHPLQWLLESGEVRREQPDPEPGPDALWTHPDPWLCTTGPTGKYTCPHVRNTP
jgi:hypothetical protein